MTIKPKWTQIRHKSKALHGNLSYVLPQQKKVKKFIRELTRLLSIVVIKYSDQNVLGEGERVIYLTFLCHWENPGQGRGHRQMLLMAYSPCQESQYPFWARSSHLNQELRKCSTTCSTGSLRWAIPLPRWLHLTESRNQKNKKHPNQHKGLCLFLKGILERVNTCAYPLCTIVLAKISIIKVHEHRSLLLQLFCLVTNKSFGKAEPS